MKNFSIVFIVLLFSVSVRAATIKEVIESNLGTHVGMQDKDERRCRFDVKEMTDNSLVMTITFQNPSRARSVRYPSGAEQFTLDALEGTLTFDKSSAGKPNLIYKFDPATLEMTSAEEYVLDTCRF